MKLLLSVLLIISCQFTIGQDLLWAKVLNNSSFSDLFDESAKGIAVDANGNIYVTGYFSGTVDFDPGPGVQNFTSSGGSDFFFAKYDASGNYIFAKTLGSIGEDEAAMAIALDNSGNILITGSFENTVDFDPGPGIQNLISNGLIDIFIAKYDGSGNYIFAKSMGNDWADRAFSIKVDGTNNIYITGTFGSTVDFDPAAGVQNLTSVGGGDIFFAKYDASGNYIFAKNIGGIANDGGLCIVLDNSENIYITGSFSVTADFDPGPGIHNITSNGNVDIFLAKYDVSGNFIFANGMGNSSLSSINAGRSLAIDGYDNVYLTGQFDGVVDFDPGPATQNLISAAGIDIYFAKYDASGNYIYAKSLSGTGSEGGTCILTDGSGNVYLTGFFNGNVDFDPNSGIQLHNSTGGEDIFLAGYDGSGNYLFSKTMGNTGFDDGFAIAKDPFGNIYLTGNIEGTVDFDPTTQLTANNSQDIFIAKYGPFSALPVKIINFKGENRGAINKLAWTTAIETNNSRFELERSSDAISFKKIGFVSSKGLNGNSTIELNYIFEDMNPMPGRNYYRLKQIDFNGQFEYSKIVLLRTSKSNAITIQNIFPNPVFENLNISINSPSKEKISIVITNVESRILKKTETILAAGDNLIPLQIKFLGPGAYFIKFIPSDKYKPFFYKFIKL